MSFGVVHLYLTGMSISTNDSISSDYCNCEWEFELKVENSPERQADYYTTYTFPDVDNIADVCVITLFE